MSLSIRVLLKWSNRIVLVIFFTKIKKLILPRKLKKRAVGVGVRQVSLTSQCCGPRWGDQGPVQVSWDHAHPFCSRFPHLREETWSQGLGVSPLPVVSVWSPGSWSKKSFSFIHLTFSVISVFLVCFAVLKDRCQAQEPTVSSYSKSERRRFLFLVPNVASQGAYSPPAIVLCNDHSFWDLFWNRSKFSISQKVWKPVAT